MSWLSELTHVHLGNVGAPIGALLGSVVPGVGTALGAGLGQAIGGVGHGDGLAKSALEGAGAYGGAKLLGGMGGGAPSADTATPGVGGGGIMSTLAGLGKSGLDYAIHNPSTLLAGAQTLNAANLGKKSNQYAENANNMANNSYAERAGLRSAGIEGMLHPQAPDVSQLAKIRQSNPYSAGLPMAQAA